MNMALAHIHRDRPAASTRSRHGMTLVEMMVAVTSTLLIMGLVAQLFSMLGQGVNGARNIVELADRVRSVQFALRHDLAGATAAGFQPPLDPAKNLGYFEYIEGPDTDLYTYRAGWKFHKDSHIFDPNIPISSGTAFDNDASLRAYVLAVGSDDRLVGDVDDILAFTTRTVGDPFTGKTDTTGNPATNSIESPFAEVIWFCRRMPNTSDPALYTLHRRQRLIAAHPGAAPFVNPLMNLSIDSATLAADGGIPNTAAQAMSSLTDVSCRVEAGRLVPNTLGDLTKRENRFLRVSTFPYVFQWNSPDLELSGARLGEDVVLTNVIGFDVRVADLSAEVRVVSDLSKSFAVTPGDHGYGIGTTSGQRGAYVDLNWREQDAPTPFRDDVPAPGLLLGGLGMKVRNNTVAPVHPLELPSGSAEFPAATYDTWSLHYEYNGRDDDRDDDENGVLADGLVDEGTNGVDDDGGGRIDEPDEAETQAPYPTRLLGLEIRIRCYEPSSRQVRQVTIRHSFPQR